MRWWPRWFAEAWANFFGYYWLPCPVCGENSGGQESSRESVPVGDSYYVTCRKESCQKYARSLPSRNATVTAGIVKVGSNLELCAASDKRRGVKLITLTVEQITRLDRIQQEHKAQQAELRALPKSRRARKRKIKIVSLPPNPEPEYAEAIEGKA